MLDHEMSATNLALPGCAANAAFAGSAANVALPAATHVHPGSPARNQYGVGEALVFAAPSRDEQDSDTEDQPLGTVIPPQQGTLDRIVDIGKARDPAPLHKSNKSRPPSVTLIVSTRSPSPTAIKGRDSTQGLPELSPTTNISSAHLVISAMDNNDDLDEFQDLFYKPQQSSSTYKEARDTSRGIPSDIHTSYSGSALTNLVRSLNEERELHIAASESSLGQKSGGPDTQRSDELSQSYVFMDMSRAPSLESANNPPAVLRLPSQNYDAPFELGVPEDIASSRASSLLITEENDTFGHPIRQGLVDAAGISTILQCPSRATSTHPEIEDDAEEVDAISPISYIDSRLRSPDGVRSSYMTSASEYSRMSALSDFPVPPTRPDLALDRTSISVDTPLTWQLQQSGNPPETEYSPGSEFHVLPMESRRTTFGGSEAIGHYTGAQV
ncbi:hypothetical protein K503DRAFT_803825 [Rhizopogon vinicolor AM-OR11-026]|uniref:Uncharacterized protein n=1 Tax=Rhizopogon vinicolor AM-OR11-026 TaxID=1314800 RepID=A0A1B7MNG5_9AGAM|nr:hypothetical protein K503DRAFT_803825 [Rhizopogon vinicolor AM-OR11-026]